MKEQIPLKECKLWWPAWQQGITFTSYGYRAEVAGDGYSFRVDPEMDSWLCPDGKLMPISEATLKSRSTLSAVSCTSFSIVGNKVQVNYLVDKHSGGYSVKYYDLDDLYFEGEAYSDYD